MDELHLERDGQEPRSQARSPNRRAHESHHRSRVEEQHTKSSGRKVKGRSGTGGSTADDDHIPPFNRGVHRLQ
jgi:hypothetical protein